MKLDANKYYEDLRFNHFQSGGTCEQRTLVLRVRFDNILEDLTAFDHITSKQKDFYTEKLNYIFKKYANNFSSEQQNKIQSLRRFLNKVQHSEVIAEEEDYVRALRTLCEMIHICSDTPIPEALINVQPLIHKKTSKAIPYQREQTDRNTYRIDQCLPISIVIDTLSFSYTKEKIEHFNQILKKFINHIKNDNLPVTLSFVFIEKNGIKQVVPFEQQNSYFEKIEHINTENINKAIKKGFQFILSHLENNNLCKPFKIKSFFVLLLSSYTAPFVRIDPDLKEFQSKGDILVLPIGLDKNVEKTMFREIAGKREPMIVSQNKYEDLFSWLLECFKISCKQ